MIPFKLEPLLLHYTDIFLPFAKFSFLYKWKSREKEMEEELTLLCSIELQKWQDEEERKQKEGSINKRINPASQRAFAEDVDCSC